MRPRERCRARDLARRPDANGSPSAADLLAAASCCCSSRASTSPRSSWAKPRAANKSCALVRAWRGPHATPPAASHREHTARRRRGDGGAALAYFATKVMVRSAHPTIPRLGDVRVDLRVLGVALPVAVATGLLFGLAPALSLTRSNQGTSAAKFSARGRGRAQRSLVACEVALSIVLLVGAGLLVRSFDKLSSIGFRSSNLLVVGMRLRASPYTDSTHTRALYAEIVHRLRLLPGVDAAAVTTLPPFYTGSSAGSFEVEGRAQSRDSQWLPSRTAARRRRSSSPPRVCRSSPAAPTPTTIGVTGRRSLW